MHVTGMQGEAASMLGGFRTGRDQVAMKNFPRGAPAAINMSEMMERRSREKKKKKEQSKDRK
jgi:hypothetical protein